MNLFELYASLTLDTSGFENSVSQAQASAQKLAVALDEATNGHKKQEKEAQKAADSLDDLAEASESAGESESELGSETNSEGEEAEKASKKNKKLKVTHVEQGSAAEKAAEAVKKLGDALKKGLVVGAKAVGAGLAAAGTAIVALTKQSVESYAEFEQLKGGVETLFGTAGRTIEEYAESSGKSVDAVRDEYAALETAQIAVMKNASEAYKNTGMSANEYMETVTGFAAALTTSLGGDTVTAAQKADRALQDMSDNANKMGTDLESIKNAYMGFSKQNYAMLDNLKLGYGGTKSEMERLLKDAQAFSGIKYDINSYADIVDAIGAIQDKMQITGTTADEAMRTIQGSVNMTKAAWQNLLTGVADEDADFGGLIDNLVTSTTAAFNNVAPRISTALTGIASAVQQIVPIIASTLPEMVASMAPALLEAASGLVTGLMDALLSVIPNLMPVATNLILSLVDYIVQALPNVLSAGISIVTTLLNGINAVLPRLAVTIVDVIGKLAIMLTEPTFLNGLIQAGIDMVMALVDGLIQSIPVLLEVVPAIIENLINAFSQANTQLADAGVLLITALVDNLPAIVADIVKAIPVIVKGLVSALASSLPAMIAAGIQLFLALIMDLPSIIVDIVKAIPEIIKALVDGFAESWPEIKAAGIDLLNQLWQGIQDAWGGLVSWFEGVWSDLFGNRQVNVDVTGNNNVSTDGSHATGLSYVPFDGYVAELHRGEMVVPASQAEAMRRGGETDAILRQILTAIEAGNQQETVLKVNSREFGRAVRNAYA